MSGEKVDFTQADLEGYDSSFEDDEENKVLVKKKREEYKTKPFIQPCATAASSSSIPPKSFFEDERRRAEGFRNRYFALNAYERHQKLINDYFLYFPGADKVLFQRDTSKDKRDIDIIRDHHRFLWKDEDDPNTWEKQLAKKYYDKLFKEYTICDLSRYKENKLALRWRIEKELLEGKGQFICGSKKCQEKESLKTWEVNFAYMEESVKKNALVKLRLCPECSVMLNFCQKRKEVTKYPKKRRKTNKDSRNKRTKAEEPYSSSTEQETVPEATAEDNNIWKAPLPDVSDSKPIEEEFDEYLEDMFL